MTLIRKISGAAHSNHIHESATKHVTGKAKYCDDITEPVGTLHAYLGVSDVAHATIKSMDFNCGQINAWSYWNYNNIRYTRYETI